ncbi:MAG: sigma-70 family RNA polymerase sigma factor [Bacteroidota bacterium]
MRQPGEGEQLKGILEGNEEVIKYVYRRNLPSITKFVVSNSGTEADAEDMFQEALIVVYDKLRKDQLKLRSSLSTFLFSICKNLWMKVLRKNKKSVKKLEGEELIADENLIESIEASEKYLLYRKYFRMLDSRCRQVLGLFISGVNTEEVMSVTGYSNAHLRKKRFECKKKLIEMIEKDPAYIEHAQRSQL